MLGLGMVWMALNRVSGCLTGQHSGSLKTSLCVQLYLYPATLARHAPSLFSGCLSRR
ncbi:hypothetical protein GCWU000324_02910 [Kingella oralis ATCC 51147]|uniref:Uncharacterized protein n=1 Tax=Kingella oralis ATCC 51147 TaxID=629741 RepID=C4GMH6_9NEIS|nr:hypothetical protein GCWU000324_02910 [Kingella oralis ATCC 51147]